MPFGTQSTCSDAESRGGRRQERFRLSASNATPSACFHSVSADVSCSCRTFCLYFFVVDLSIWQTQKKQDDSFVVHCDNVHTARSSRTCTYMQGRQFSLMLAVRRRTGKCGAQHLVSLDGDRSVLLNVSTSKSTFTCCVDRDAKQW